MAFSSSLCDNHCLLTHWCWRPSPRMAHSDRKIACNRQALLRSRPVFNVGVVDCEREDGWKKGEVIHLAIFRHALTTSRHLGAPSAASSFDARAEFGSTHKHRADMASAASNNAAMELAGMVHKRSGASTRTPPTAFKQKRRISESRYETH